MVSNGDETLNQRSDDWIEIRRDLHWLHFGSAGGETLSGAADVDRILPANRREQPQWNDCLTAELFTGHFSCRVHRSRTSDMPTVVRRSREANSTFYSHIDR